MEKNIYKSYPPTHTHTSSTPMYIYIIIVGAKSKNNLRDYVAF